MGKICPWHRCVGGFLFAKIDSQFSSGYYSISAQKLCDNLMNFQEKITEDLKNAMREKNELKLSVLRMAVSAMKNKQIEKRAKGGDDLLTDEEAMAVFRSEVKKRRDAIGEYQKGGRAELAEKETAELAILETYLPQEMSDEEIMRRVKETVETLGNVTIKDFGKVMGEAMKRIRGQASGDRVSAAVKKVLT